MRNHGVVSIRAWHHESGTPLAEIRVRGRLRFGHASSMDLREFTADDAASVRIATGIENVRNAVDAPWELPLSEHRMAMEVRHGWDGEPGRYFLAYDGDTAVGLGHIGASEWDNLDLAWLDLKVLPERRRSGHGTALLDGLLAEVRATERHLVGVDAWDGTPGPAFAEAHGFVHRSQEIKRRMHLAELGDDLSTTLGAPASGARLALVAAVALAAVATAATGPIAFIAFVSGPIARRLCGGRASLWAAALVGAVVVVLADFAGDYLIPDVNLPVGVVTGAIGAPLMIAVIVAAGRAGKA